MAKPGRCEVVASGPGDGPGFPQRAIRRRPGQISKVALVCDCGCGHGCGADGWIATRIASGCGSGTDYAAPGDRGKRIEHGARTFTRRFVPGFCVGPLE